MSAKQPQYKKKGDTTAPVEETKGSDAPARGGARGGFRGGRGANRAGQEGGESRPKTTGGDSRPKTAGGSNGEHRGGERRPHYQRRKEHGGADGVEEEGGERKQREQREPRKEQDQNSWVYKYHYQERPKHDYKIEITPEIEVPSVVPKEQRQKNPDKAVFDKTLTDIESQIEAKREKIRTLGAKKKETLEGGKVSGS
jgi:hypothetical protein